MKLRSSQSALASSSSTPSTLLPANTGVTKTVNKSARATTKAKGASSIHRAKKPSPSKTNQAKPAGKAAKKFTVRSRAKSSASSRKKTSNKIAQNAATSSENGLAGSAVIDPALDPAMVSEMGPEMGPAKGPAASRRSTKVKPEKRECVVCTNSKYPGRNNANFPKFSNCDHEPLTCTDCIMKHALIRLKTRRVAFTNGGPPSFWSAVTCPQCNIALTETDIRAAVSRKDIKTIREMVTLNELHTDRRWVWCVSDTCGSGQIHKKATKKDTEAARMVKCKKCGVKSCFSHREAWHEGLTCAQYDDRNPKSESIRTTEERIRNMTKQCPTAGCGWRIQKDGGCSSMYCPKCEQYFAWSHVSYDKNATPEPEVGSW